jgi:hypothetical protein
MVALVVVPACSTPQTCTGLNVTPGYNEHLAPPGQLSCPADSPQEPDADGRNATKPGDGIERLVCYLDN